MAHDVFISHSVKDKTIADAVCATLEAEGIRCWIAPRDVTPGMEWGGAIIGAIKQARIMVLVFTANANASPQIRREVERAINHDVVILPFRVENVIPDESLEYFIGNLHWLDALTPPLEAHLKSLAGTLKVLLARMQPAAALPVLQPEPPVAAEKPDALLPSLATELAAWTAEPLPPEPFDATAASSPAFAVSRLDEGPKSGAAAAEELSRQPRPAEPAEVQQTPPPATPLRPAALSPGASPAEVVRPFAIDEAPVFSAIETAPEEVTAEAGDQYCDSPDAAESAEPAEGLFRSSFPELRSGSATVHARKPRRVRVWVLSGAVALALLLVVLFAIRSRTGPSASSSPPQASPPTTGGGGGGSGGGQGNGPAAPQSPQRSGNPFVAPSPASTQRTIADAPHGATVPKPEGTSGGSSSTASLTPQELAEEAYPLIQQKRYAEAKPLAELACDRGNAEGCNDLGWLYDGGHGVSQDYTQAASLYKKSCDGGLVHGCDNLGDLYRDGHGVSQDYTQAASLHKQACDGGDASGCNDLGWLYDGGHGVSQDYTQAASLYKKSCDGGLVHGCDNLGDLYRDGLGVSQDYTQAASLYKQACDGGDASGCNDLGLLYGNGQVGAQDYAQARSLFQKSCDGGNADGCSNLGWMYQNGRGVARDYTQAVALFKKACDGGSAIGCGNLGELYAIGLGVTHDSAKGRSLLQKGCSGGNQWSCNQLKRLQ